MTLLRDKPALVTIAVFALLYALCVAQFPFMFSLRVAGNLLTDNAHLGVLAVGMTVVILSGGIDLSVGAVVAFTGVLLAVLIEQAGIPAPAAFAIALILGTGFGALVGFAIDRLKAPPFIVTLAAMFLARGACFLLTTDSIPVSDPLYDALSGHGFPSFAAIAMLLAFLLGALMLQRTRFGANVRAIGGDAHAAALMGVPVARTTIGIYAFSGLTSALAGILFSLYTQSAHSLAAVGMELDAIAAVVIGGTLLTGGAGGVLGTLFGVLILGLIQSYITFNGTLSSWWAKIATGLLLFAFVALQRIPALFPAPMSAKKRA
jgi:ribose/xylose/arabinose/galactoside ABC-type transport system permease subunit